MFPVECSLDIACIMKATCWISNEKQITQQRTKEKSGAGKAAIRDVPLARLSHFNEIDLYF